MIDKKYFVIDAHCHIFDQKIAERAVAGTANFYNLPAHGDGTLDFLINEGVASGIDRFIVQSVATAPHQVDKINEFIADEVNKNPDKLVGLGTLHPDSKTLKEDLQKILHLGLKGVKLHPDIQAFKIDDYRCLKIYEMCEENRLPILMHTGDHRYDFSNPNRLAPVLDIFKGLTVIGAHFGGWSVWDDAIEKLADKPNLYVDCSSSFTFMEKDFAIKLIKSYGANRVLFGSDYPIGSPKKEVELFMGLGLTEDENRQILSENAIKLFGLEK